MTSANSAFWEAVTLVAIVLTVLIISTIHVNNWWPQWPASSSILPQGLTSGDQDQVNEADRTEGDGLDAGDEGTAAGKRRKRRRKANGSQSDTSGTDIATPGTGQGNRGSAVHGQGNKHGRSGQGQGQGRTGNTGGSDPEVPTTEDDDPGSFRNRARGGSGSANEASTEPDTTDNDSSDDGSGHPKGTQRKRTTVSSMIGDTTVTVPVDGEDDEVVFDDKRRRVTSPDIPDNDIWHDASDDPGSDGGTRGPPPAGGPSPPTRSKAATEQQGGSSAQRHNGRQETKGQYGASLNSAAPNKSVFALPNRSAPTQNSNDFRVYKMNLPEKTAAQEEIENAAWMRSLLNGTLFPPLAEAQVEKPTEAPLTPVSPEKDTDQVAFSPVDLDVKKIHADDKEKKLASPNKSKNTDETPMKPKNKAKTKKPIKLQLQPQDVSASGESAKSVNISAEEEEKIALPSQKEKVKEKASKNAIESEEEKSTKTKQKKAKLSPLTLKDKKVKPAKDSSAEEIAAVSGGSESAGDDKPGIKAAKKKKQKQKIEVKATDLEAASGLELSKKKKEKVPDSEDDKATAKNTKKKKSKIAVSEEDASSAISSIENKKIKGKYRKRSKVEEKEKAMAKKYNAKEKALLSEEGVSDVEEEVSDRKRQDTMKNKKKVESHRDTRAKARVKHTEVSETEAEPTNNAKTRQKLAAKTSSTMFAPEELSEMEQPTQKKTLDASDLKKAKTKRVRQRIEIEAEDGATPEGIISANEQDKLSNLQASKNNNGTRLPRAKSKDSDIKQEFTEHITDPQSATDKTMAGGGKVALQEAAKIKRNPKYKESKVIHEDGTVEHTIFERTDPPATKEELSSSQLGKGEDKVKEESSKSAIDALNQNAESGEAAPDQAALHQPSKSSTINTSDTQVQHGAYKAETGALPVAEQGTVEEGGQSPKLVTANPSALEDVHYIEQKQQRKSEKKSAEEGWRAARNAKRAKAKHSLDMSSGTAMQAENHHIKEMEENIVQDEFPTNNLDQKLPVAEQTEEVDALQSASDLQSTKQQSQEPLTDNLAEQELQNQEASMPSIKMAIRTPGIPPRPSRYRNLGKEHTASPGSALLQKDLVKTDAVGNQETQKIAHQSKGDPQQVPISFQEVPSSLGTPSPIQKTILGSATKETPEQAASIDQDLVFSHQGSISPGSPPPVNRTTKPYLVPDVEKTAHGVLSAGQKSEALSPAPKASHARQPDIPQSQLYEVDPNDQQPDHKTISLQGYQAPREQFSKETKFDNRVTPESMRNHPQDRRFSPIQAADSAVDGQRGSKQKPYFKSQLSSKEELHDITGQKSKSVEKATSSRNSVNIRSFSPKQGNTMSTASKTGQSDHKELFTVHQTEEPSIQAAQPNSMVPQPGISKIIADSRTGSKSSTEYMTELDKTYVDKIRMDRTAKRQQQKTAKDPSLADSIQPADNEDKQDPSKQVPTQHTSQEGPHAPSVMRENDKESNASPWLGSPTQDQSRIKQKKEAKKLAKILKKAKETDRPPQGIWEEEKSAAKKNVETTSDQEHEEPQIARVKMQKGLFEDRSFLPDATRHKLSMETYHQENKANKARPTSVDSWELSDENDNMEEPDDMGSIGPDTKQHKIKQKSQERVLNIENMAAVGDSAESPEQGKSRSEEIFGLQEVTVKDTAQKEIKQYAGKLRTTKRIPTDLQTQGDRSDGIASTHQNNQNNTQEDPIPRINNKTSNDDGLLGSHEGGYGFKTQNFASAIAQEAARRRGMGKYDKLNEEKKYEGQGDVVTLPQVDSPIVSQADEDDWDASAPVTRKTHKQANMEQKKHEITTAQAKSHPVPMEEEECLSDDTIAVKGQDGACRKVLPTADSASNIYKSKVKTKQNEEVNQNTDWTSGDESDNTLIGEDESVVQTTSIDKEKGPMFHLVNKKGEVKPGKTAMEDTVCMKMGAPDIKTHKALEDGRQHHIMANKAASKDKKRRVKRRVMEEDESLPAPVVTKSQPSGPVHMTANVIKYVASTLRHAPISSICFTGSVAGSAMGSRSIAGLAFAVSKTGVIVRRDELPADMSHFQTFFSKLVKNDGSGTTGVFMLLNIWMMLSIPIMVVMGSLMVSNANKGRRGIKTEKKAWNTMPVWIWDTIIILIIVTPYIMVLFAYQMVLEQASKQVGEVSGLQAVLGANAIFLVLTLPLVYAVMKIQGSLGRIRRIMACCGR